MALEGKQTIRGGLNKDRMSANGPGLGM